MNLLFPSKLRFCFKNKKYVSNFVDLSGEVSVRNHSFRMPNSSDSVDEPCCSSNVGCSRTLSPVNKRTRLSETDQLFKTPLSVGEGMLYFLLGQLRAHRCDMLFGYVILLSIVILFYVCIIQVDRGALSDGQNLTMTMSL